MKFIIPMIVGAIIGYFTNWLAIKMLFRPHEEKRIFGIRIPFTPGLIPKERYRVSESIGKAVGEHLLTPEKITEVLSSEETKDNLNTWLNTNIDRLKENNKSIRDILDELEIYDYHKTLDKMEEVAVDNIISTFKKDRVKEEILGYLEHNVYEKYKHMAFENLYLKGGRFLNEISTSPELKALLINELQGTIEDFQDDDRLLKDVISQESMGKIYENIDSNKDNIIGGLRGLLHEPKLEKRLKLSIEDIVDKNISKVITMFLSPEIISEKVFHIIYKYIDSEEAEKMTLFAINNSLDKIFNSRLCDLTKDIMKFAQVEEIENMVDLILNQLNKDENQEKLVEVLINNIKDRDPEIKRGLLNIIGEKLEPGLDSKEFRKSILVIMDLSINNLLHRPISILLKDINEDGVNRVTEYIGDIIHRFGGNSLMEVISSFNVSKIVEDQINSFHVEYTENLIIDIAQKELNAITNLGALLGGIIGLLTPLLQILL